MPRRSHRPALRSQRPRMEPSTSGHRTTANSGASVLLGPFILWQLFFLTAYNFIDLFAQGRDELKTRDRADDVSYEEASALTDPIAPGWAKERGQINDLMEVLRTITRRYAQITGQ